MKYFKTLMILFFVFIGCTSKKAITSTGNIANLSAEQIVSNHYNSAFLKKTIEAKIKINYRDNNREQSLTVKMRLQKDEVIWFSANVMGFVVARAKITPTKMMYYEKIDKTFFEGDFSAFENFLGTEINFHQLQNILFGEAFFDLKNKKMNAQTTTKNYFLAPQKQNAFFDLLFYINPNHFKIEQQQMINPSKNQALRVDYKSYQTIDNVIFPKEILITAKQNKFTSQVKMEINSVTFNETFTTPYEVPNGYKQVNF